MELVIKLEMQLVDYNFILLKIGKHIEYYGITKSRQLAQSGESEEGSYKSKDIINRHLT